MMTSRRHSFKTSGRSKALRANRIRSKSSAVVEAILEEDEIDEDVRSGPTISVMSFPCKPGSPLGSDAWD